MPRIVIKHTRGMRAGTREIYPTARFDALSIGRDPESDIAFGADERSVSRSHALIEWEAAVASTITVSDLLSANGTFVNGRKAQGATRLRTGDRIRLGPSGPEFEIVIETGGDPARPQPLPATEQIPVVPDERDPDYEARRAPSRRRGKQDD